MNLLLLYGGRSGEHEISLISSRFILANLDPEKYRVFPVWIDHEGSWYYVPLETALKAADKLPPGNIPCRLIQENSGAVFQSGNEKVSVDFVFPGLHGPFGEDGKLQGYLETLGTAYAGSGVLGSSLSMDKIAARNVLKSLGIPQVKYLGLLKKEYEKDPEVWAKKIENELPYPIFVKPANLGSSVGVSKARNRQELEKGMKEAFLYDSRLILEEGKTIRECETAIIGNAYSESITTVGEIKVNADFYSYEAKYLDPEGSEVKIPANLRPEQIEEAKQIALAAYRGLCCAGYARADLFYEAETESFYFNEINTLPGLTPVSMFPMLWKDAGLSGPEIMDRIIQAGLEMHRERSSLKYKYSAQS